RERRLEAVDRGRIYPDNRFASADTPGRHWLGRSGACTLRAAPADPPGQQRGHERSGEGRGSRIQSFPLARNSSNVARKVVHSLKVSSMWLCVTPASKFASIFTVRSPSGRRKAARKRRLSFHFPT